MLRTSDRIRYTETRRGHSCEECGVTVWPPRYEIEMTEGDGVIVLAFCPFCGEALEARVAEKGVTHAGNRGEN